MAIVTIDNLRNGMVLNRDTKNTFGQLLLPSGTVLTDKHIYTLKAWGVTETDIKGISEEDVSICPKEKIDPLELHAIEEELNIVFFHYYCNNPVIKELTRLVTLRKAASCKKERDED